MIIDNDCWEAEDYIEEAIGYRPIDGTTISKMEKIFDEREICLWNYPLTEIDHIIENSIDVVLVRFSDGYDGYDYRFCEMPNETIYDEED